MCNRITSTITLIAFFASLVPAPAALALRQTQEGSSAEAVGRAIGGVKADLQRKKVPGISQITLLCAGYLMI